MKKRYIKKSDLEYYFRETKKDKEFQKRLKKYICYGLPIGTFAAILIINFIFWVFTGKVG